MQKEIMHCVFALGAYISVCLGLEAVQFSLKLQSINMDSPGLAPLVVLKALLKVCLNVSHLRHKRLISHSVI